MVLGLQNALWRSKRVLEQLMHFGRQKVSAWQVLRKGILGILKPLVNFELQSAPLEHLGHFGSHWGPGLAGWLLRAQSPGLRAHG